MMRARGRVQGAEHRKVTSILRAPSSTDGFVEVEERGESCGLRTSDRHVREVVNEGWLRRRKAEQSVLVCGFELVCATKSCALREVRSRTVHCEVSMGASAIQKSNLLPRWTMLW